MSQLFGKNDPPIQQDIREDRLFSAWSYRPGYRAETGRAGSADIEQDEIIKNGLLCGLLKVLCQ